jgi:hypothetical protein
MLADEAQQRADGWQAYNAYMYTCTTRICTHICVRRLLAVCALLADGSQAYTAETYAHVR